MAWRFNIDFSYFKVFGPKSGPKWAQSKVMRNQCMELPDFFHRQTAVQRLKLNCDEPDSKKIFFLKFYNKLMHWTSIIFGMRYEVKTASRLEIDWTYFDKILALGYVRQKGPEFIGLDLFCNQFLTLKVIQVFNCTLHENHFSYLYLWVQCHVLLFPFVLRQ